MKKKAGVVPWTPPSPGGEQDGLAKTGGGCIGWKELLAHLFGQDLDHSICGRSPLDLSGKLCAQKAVRQVNAEEQRALTAHPVSPAQSFFPVQARTGAEQFS